MLKDEQFELYGKVIDGTESELDLAKLLRVRYLKMKMRERLAHEIGDDPDSLTDTIRSVLICYGVSSGIITDQQVISRLNSYVSEMIQKYGGATAIMDILEFDKDAVDVHVMSGYFPAKLAIMAAALPEEVMAIDLPD